MRFSNFSPIVPHHECIGFVRPPLLYVALASTTIYAMQMEKNFIQTNEIRVEAKSQWKRKMRRQWQTAKNERNVAFGTLLRFISNFGRNY